MNRRYFLAASGASLLTLLAGCKTDQDGAKFVGYWKSDSKYDPDAIHIERNGDSFLFTLVTKDPFGGGYQIHKLPAKLDTSANILIVGDKQIAYDAKADVIVSNQMKARHATEAEFQAIAQTASQP